MLPISTAQQLRPDIRSGIDRKPEIRAESVFEINSEKY